MQDELLQRPSIPPLLITYFMSLSLTCLLLQVTHQQFCFVHLGSKRTQKLTIWSLPLPDCLQCCHICGKPSSWLQRQPPSLSAGCSLSALSGLSLFYLSRVRREQEDDGMEKERQWTERLWIYLMKTYNASVQPDRLSLPQTGAGS